MNTSYWLRNVRPYGGAAEDWHIENGRIAVRQLAAQQPCAAADVDGGGQLLLPALVESHIHLDKTLWGLPWRPHSAGPNLKARIANERQVLRTVDTPIAQRAGALLEHCIGMGSLTFRCHVDVDPELGFGHVEAMLALRERYADLADIQYVAFPQAGLIHHAGTAEMMRAALEQGIDLVGGLDPCGIDNDPIAHLTAIFQLAAEYDRAVDIHLHDGGELGLWQIARIADFTERYGRQHKVMISHAFCLGMLPWARVEATAARLAAPGISIMTTAPADIGVPPFAELTAIGVNVCLGSDGIRDAWGPYGNGDMLERAMLQAYRFYSRSDEGLHAAFDAASVNGARALGCEQYGVEIGQPADFLLLPVETLAEAVVMRPAERTVFRRGHVVARAGKLLENRL